MLVSFRWMQVLLPKDVAEGIFNVGIPACANCQGSDSTCEYTDPYTKEKRPRAHLIELERQARRLEDTIRQLKQQRKKTGQAIPSQEIRHQPDVSADDDAYPELIHFESGGDGHFLGASSGLHIARSVLQSTQSNKNLFEKETVSQKNRRDSSVPHPYLGIEPLLGLEELPLPQWDTFEGLVEVFFRQFEVTCPILLQSEFISDVQSIYAPHTDATEQDSRTRFMLHTVLSISYHLVSQDSLELTTLAEKHRIKASAQLGDFVGEQDHRTLQCLLLHLLSSMLHHGSTPMWYISGICMRMCVDLGYYTESLIVHAADSSSGVAANTKRRLFWVTYCFDRSLAIMLGRPFFIDEDRIEVRIPVEDSGSHCQGQALHWLKMKRMESTIARHLHSLHTTAAPDCDKALTTLDEEVDQWLMEAESFMSEGAGNFEIWAHAHASAKLMLHRPLLMRPAWSNRSILESYDAAMKLIHLNFIRVQKGLLEFTWLDLHSHLVNGLTLLFLVLRSQEAQEATRKGWIQFKSCVVEWQMVSDRLATRWDSVAKMKDVLSRLADETLESIQESQARTYSRGRDSFARREAMHKPSFEGQNARPEHPSTASGQRIAACTQAMGDKVANTELTSPEYGSDWGHIREDFRKDIADPQILNAHYDHSSYGAAPLFDNLDFPSILDGNFWAELEQFDIPLQPHLNPMTGDQPLLEPHGSVFGHFGGRLDSTVTDSVLNFHGNFEGGDASM